MNKIRPLDVGLEAITRWREVDEVSLPREGGLTPTFLPVHRALDEILRRPSLDERLTALMEPENLDPSLLAPSALSQTRGRVRDRLAEAARRHAGRKRDLFLAAANLLANDMELDQAVYESLAALLRG